MHVVAAARRKPCPLLRRWFAFVLALLACGLAAAQGVLPVPELTARVIDQTGTLEPGKRADVVLWSANPFSIYAVAEKVYIDGALSYDRNDPRFQPRSDFELGLEARR